MSWELAIHFVFNKKGTVGSEEEIPLAAISCQGLDDSVEGATDSELLPYGCGLPGQILAKSLAESRLHSVFDFLLQGSRYGFDSAVQGKERHESLCGR